MTYGIPLRMVVGIIPRDDELVIRPLGRLFLRDIASALDAHLNPNDAQYSISTEPFRWQQKVRKTVATG
jgi:hypothetical protein